MYSTLSHIALSSHQSFLHEKNSEAGSLSKLAIVFRNSGKINLQPTTYISWSERSRHFAKFSLS